MLSIISVYWLPRVPASLQLEMGDRDNPGIFRRLGANEVVKFGRRVADRDRRLAFQDLLDLRIPQRLDRGLLQPVDDLLRRPRARQQPEPVGEIEILKALDLGQRGNVGE